MFCKKCGNLLKEDDLFCNKCGTKVIKSKLEDTVMTEENEFTGYIPPKETFNWNINGFPDQEQKKTEDVNFNWNAFDEFHKEREVKKPTEPEIVFGTEKEAQVEPGTRYKVPKYEVPKLDKVVGPKMWSEPQKIEETLKVDNASDVEMCDKPQEKEETPNFKTWVPPTTKSKLKDTVEEENIVKGVELEEELFGETSSIPISEALQGQKEKIDKFYTFNRKNEEFQKLLDKEYEKYSSGKPTNEAISGIGFDEDRGLTAEEEWPVRDEGQIKEMAEARDVFFGAESKEEQKEEINKESKENEKSISSNIKDKEEPEKKKKTEEPEEPKKNGKTGKTILIILAILLIIVLAMVAIKSFAPNSGVSQQIDKITTIFTGEKTVPTAIEEDRNIPAEDKTGIIQLVLGQNKDNAIKQISYNAVLKYDSSITYSDKDIKTSKVIENNNYYTDKNGEKHYLDEDIVGATLAYASEKADKNGISNFEIGEIRKGNKGYYIWIANDDEKQVYLVINKSHKMMVTEVYSL